MDDKLNPDADVFVPLAAVVLSHMARAVPLARLYGEWDKYVGMVAGVVRSLPEPGGKNPPLSFEGAWGELRMVAIEVSTGDDASVRMWSNALRQMRVGVELELRRLWYDGLHMPGMRPCSEVERPTAARAYDQLSMFGEEIGKARKLHKYT